MDDYFSGIGRKIFRDQIMKGEYKLVAGDYIRFEWSGGQHSANFIEYLSDSSKPLDSNIIKTIESNTSSTVVVRTSRTFKDHLSVGNCY